MPVYRQVDKNQNEIPIKCKMQNQNEIVSPAPRFNSRGFWALPSGIFFHSSTDLYPWLSSGAG